MSPYEMMRANHTRGLIIEDEELEAIKQTKFKLRCHHKLLILHEIVSDVKLYKDMRSADDAQDYGLKLELIKERKEMIKELNKKYGSGTANFLKILEQFKEDPHLMLSTPDHKVKRLIQETLEKYLQQSKKAFRFRNSNMGDMYDLLLHWWDELKGGAEKKISEVTKKEFLRFLLKKRIIVDEKEADGLFKELAGDSTLNEKTHIKQQEFFRIFMRSCFRGALQNVFDFIEKSSVVLKSLPISIKVLVY